MKSSLRFAFVFILLTGGAIAGPPEDGDKFLKWHKEMIGVPLPKKGCFKVVYPNKVWVEDKCATPLQGTYWTGGGGGGFAGNAGNFSARVTSGHISSAIGSFDSAIVTSASGNLPANYSLQLNSQAFDTPACAGSKDPSRCKGVQQFVYVPTPIAGGYIQYWLLNYRTADHNVCPEPNDPRKNANWRPMNDWDCTRFSELSIAGPTEPAPISNLKGLRLGGTARAGNWDVLTVRTDDRTLCAVNEDNILNLADQWRIAEFSVFGDGNGTAVEFNPGTSLIVRTSVVNGTTNPPKCVRTHITGETNNLKPVEPCCAYGGATPSIVFMLSLDRDAVSPCAPGRRRNQQRR